MQYTDQCLLLKNKGLKAGTLNSGILNNKLQADELEFHSDFSWQYFGSNPDTISPVFSDSEQTTQINSHFTYLIIKPRSKQKSSKCIVLLHGLNERSWDKYIPWAAKLAELTQQAIILFPIAFHMNRSPAKWNNPRAMTPYVQQRLRLFRDDRELSFVNVALSERLTLHPERFFLAGYQSAQDIIKLVDLIQSGNHPLFYENTRVNFFAYSIGVMLSQVLLLAEPKRFEQSKFLFFCGGSALEGMHGNSKFIMDEIAFSKLNAYYAKREKEKGVSGMLSDLMNHTKFGKAFRKISMHQRNNSVKKGVFAAFNKQLFTFYLKRDTVIPWQAIKTTLKGTQLCEFDFPFQYSHVVPFPVFRDEKKNMVDQVFDNLFTKAAAFLS